MDNLKNFSLKKQKVPTFFSMKKLITKWNPGSSNLPRLLCILQAHDLSSSTPAKGAVHWYSNICPDFVPTKRCIYIQYDRKGISNQEEQSTNNSCRRDLLTQQGGLKVWGLAFKNTTKPVGHTIRRSFCRWQRRPSINGSQVPMRYDGWLLYSSTTTTTWWKTTIFCGATQKPFFRYDEVAWTTTYRSTKGGGNAINHKCAQPFNMYSSMYKPTIGFVRAETTFSFNANRSMTETVDVVQIIDIGIFGVIDCQCGIP